MLNFSISSHKRSNTLRYVRLRTTKVHMRQAAVCKLSIHEKLTNFLKNKNKVTEQTKQYSKKFPFEKAGGLHVVSKFQKTCFPLKYDT